VNEAELVTALDAAADGLPFCGPFTVVPIQTNVFRLDAASGSFFAKWLAADGWLGFNKITVNRTWLASDPIKAPPLLATVEAAGGMIACWAWLAGSDLRDAHRHRMPEAFGEIGRLHARHRHTGPVVGHHTNKTFASIQELVADECDRLLPLVDASLRRRMASILGRLAIGMSIAPPTLALRSNNERCPNARQCTTTADAAGSALWWQPRACPVVVY